MTGFGKIIAGITAVMLSAPALASDQVDLLKSGERLCVSIRHEAGVGKVLNRDFETIDTVIDGQKAMVSITPHQKGIQVAISSMEGKPSFLITQITKDQVSAIGSINGKFEESLGLSSGNYSVCAEVVEAGDKEKSVEPMAALRLGAAWKLDEPLYREEVTEAEPPLSNIKLVPQPTTLDLEVQIN